MKKYLISVLLLFLLLLGTGAKLLYDKFSALNNEIISLKSKNKKLVTEKKSLETKNNNNKKRMRKHRNALIVKKKKRAQLKIYKAPLGTIPFIGAAAVAGLVANDIHNSCEDIKEFKELEESMFGTFDHNVSEDEKFVCGYDIYNELLPALENSQKDFSEWIDKCF